MINLFLDFDGVINLKTSDLVWDGTADPIMFDYATQSVAPNKWKLEPVEYDNSIHFAPNSNTIIKAPLLGYLNASETQEITLSWSSELVDELQKIANNPNVNIIWLTTWRKLAKTRLESLIGLKTDRSYALDWTVKRQDYTQGFKVKAIKDFYQSLNGKSYGSEDPAVGINGLFLQESSTSFNADDNSPLIWIDDVANTQYADVIHDEETLPSSKFYKDIPANAVEVANEVVDVYEDPTPHIYSPRESLVIKTDDRFGITRDHMGRIHNFIAKHSS